MIQFFNNIATKLKGVYNSWLSKDAPARKRQLESNSIDQIDICSDEESDSETTAKLLKRRRIDTGHIMTKESQKESASTSQDCNWIRPRKGFDRCFVYEPVDSVVPFQSFENSKRRNHFLGASTSKEVPLHNDFFSASHSAQGSSTVGNDTLATSSMSFKKHMFAKPSNSQSPTTEFAVPSSSSSHNRVRNRKVHSNEVRLRARRGLTAMNSIRLEEKEKYRQLLLKYQAHEGHLSFSNSVSPNQTDSTRSNSSASQRQENGVSFFNHDPIPAKCAVQTEKISTVDKYMYTRRILGKDNRRLSFNTMQGESRFGNGSFQGRTPLLRRSLASRNETPVEIVKLDSDDSSEKEVQIIKEEPPSTWKSTLSAAPFGPSPYTSVDWLKEWKRKNILDKDHRKEEIDKAKTHFQSKKENCEKLIQGLGNDIQKQLRLSIETVEVLEEDFKDEEEEEKEKLSEITSEMDEVIEAALHPHPPDEVLVEAFRLQIRRRDMETLQDLNWLNDEVINFYMNLLMERGKLDNTPSVYACNTFFYPKLLSGGHNVLKRWTRKVDIFSHNFMLVPVHLGVHWCLAVVHFTEKTLRYYDSMGGKNNECLKALCSYLQAESLDKKKKPFDMVEWVIENAKDIPQQMNSSDCGMFACKYAEYITRNSKITFKQEDMPHFRRQMVYEILNKRLL